MKESYGRERKRAVKSRRNNSRETQTSTVKSAERVDRGQEAIKRLHSTGRQLGFAGRISKRRPKQDDELAEFEKTAPYGRCSMCNLALINLTLSEKIIQTCTKTACEARGLETEMEVEWTVYEISFSGKNLEPGRLREST